MADDSMRSTVHQPKRGEHDHDYVNKTDDRGPHQVNVAGLKVVEEPANRDQHRHKTSTLFTHASAMP